MKYCTICKEKFDDSVSFCPVDGEVLEGDPASIVNTVLDGQYQMEALLGKGGMGAVYRARHILLGDRVAIKVLPPEVRTNAEWLRRFRREGQAARRFRHPNAVTVYDLRTAADGTIYMVMEYVEGHTLDAELKKRGKFTPKDALEILTPIMSVLDTAHSMGVVHRDLKPENIMIGTPSGNGEPVVKLLDLGIAKMREIAGAEAGGNTALTMAGQVLGTPYYMSPEQWGEIPRDGNIEIDGRADIYSLGLVFYELIAGRRCYQGTTLHELRREHVSAHAKPLFEAVPDVPRGFSDAIARATAKDRDDRQPTASALASDLKAGLGTATAGGFSSPALNETVTITPNLQTKSDTNAPTVIGVDVSETSAPSTSQTAAPVAAEQPKPRPVVDPTVVASATLVESADMSASATVQSPQPIVHHPVVQAPVAPPASKSKVGLLIGLVVVAVVFVALAVGGFLIYSKMKSSTPTTSTTQGTTTPPAAPVEVAKYWIELQPKSDSEQPVRVAELVPIASGQSMRFHFNFNDDGYLYIFGPGKDTNSPTAFLTSKPLDATGWSNNRISKGESELFPREFGILHLDDRPGTDTFTVIFSKTELSTPSFLNGKVNGEPLNGNEQNEFRAFVQKYGKSPSTELDKSDPKAHLVRVKVSGDESNNPAVFEIRIQHN